PAEAFTILDEAWTEADAARDGVAAFTITWTSVVQLFDLGDPEAVRLRCRRELDTGRHSQAPSTRGILNDELGRALAVAGDLDARQHLEQAKGLAAGTEDWRGLAGRLALAEAVVLWAEGQDQEAEGRASAAIEVFRRFVLPWDEADAQRRVARARYGRGDR